MASRLKPDRLESLTEATREAIATAGTGDWLRDFYLAGGGALALRIGHREVRDLDWMAGSNRLAPADRRDLLAALLAAFPGLSIETARDGYLAARTAGGVGLRFFCYPYPLVDPTDDVPTVPGAAVASAIDLGLMKIAAIISRGGKRDFVDLHLLCREIPLATLLTRAAEKFGHVGDFALQAMKGLADLEAARPEPMPRLAAPLAWETVEAWVEDAVRAYGASLLETSV